MPAVAYILADAANELKEFVSHLALPVAHSLMGKGVLPDDHPLTLGMTGFWGTKFINENAATLITSLRWVPASPRPIAARGRANTRSTSLLPA